MGNSLSLGRSLRAGLGLAIVAIVSAVSIARADIVTYSTAGSFNGGGNSITFLGGGGSALMVTFTGLGSTTLNDAPFPFSSLGNFQTFVSGTGATITPGTTFSLTVTQTAPTAGSAGFAGTLSGTLSSSIQSTGRVDFSVTSLTIGNETYALTNNFWALVPPASNNGITTVQATITPVPEPASLALVVSGLAALGGYAVFRRR